MVNNEPTTHEDFCDQEVKTRLDDNYPYLLLQVDELEASPTPRLYDVLEFDGDFNPPPENLEEINYLPDYLLTLLLPTLIALLLCLLLSYIMCCRREGV